MQITNHCFKCGCIDINGNQIVDMKYDFGFLCYSDGYFVGVKDNKYVVIDKNGKELIGDIDRVDLGVNHYSLGDGVGTGCYVGEIPK